MLAKHFCAEMIRNRELLIAPATLDVLYSGSKSMMKYHSFMLIVCKLHLSALEIDAEEFSVIY